VNRESAEGIDPAPNHDFLIKAMSSLLTPQNTTSFKINKNGKPVKISEFDNSTQILTATSNCASLRLAPLHFKDSLALHLSTPQLH